MRIGILGGTFDPIHNGHLYLAKEVCKKLALKKVIFIPAYLPPHKRNIKISGQRHRRNMIKLAIRGKKRFTLSDIELRRKGRSYSVVTLKQLRKRYSPNTDIFFITGSDSLKDLDKWRDVRGILRLCSFVVVKRPGFKIKKRDTSFITLNINAKNISSSDIRRRVKHHRSIVGLVTPKISSYIKKHGLYQARP